MSDDLSRAEDSIVEVVSALVGPFPIILAGSRATGEATTGSDYDVYVVLPMHRVLGKMSRLRHAAEVLECQLHAPITLNPLPAFRLARPGHTLIVWKLRREGKVLSPPSFQLSAPWVPVYDDVAIASYALSGLRYLVEDLEPRLLGEPNVPPAVSALVRKALRHAAQIELLRERRYESSLSGAIAALPAATAETFRSLAASADRSSTWFAVRDRLVERARHETASPPRRFVINAQYVALAAMRTRRPPLRVLISSRAVSDQLGRALVEMTLAVEADGTVDSRRLRGAIELMPEAGGQAPPSWTKLRDDIDAKWSDAHPLVGF